MDQLELIKQTLTATIAGNIASVLINKHSLDQEIIDRTIKITKGIVEGLYA